MLGTLLLTCLNFCRSLLQSQRRLDRVSIYSFILLWLKHSYNGSNLVLSVIIFFIIFGMIVFSALFILCVKIFCPEEIDKRKLKVQSKNSPLSFCCCKIRLSNFFYPFILNRDILQRKVRESDAGQEKARAAQKCRKLCEQSNAIKQTSRMQRQFS